MEESKKKRPLRISAAQKQVFSLMAHRKHEKMRARMTDEQIANYYREKAKKRYNKKDTLEPPGK